MPYERRKTPPKKKTRCSSVPWISCFERQDETNGRMTPQALNKFLSEFLITVRKKENTTKNMSLIPYRLSSPVFSAIYYVLCLMKNVQFEQTWRALQSKQRDLKRKGMGNKPNASAALSEEDIQALFEKDLLEVWFNNIIHFGLLGCKERRQMCWGDVK